MIHIYLDQNNIYEVRQSMKNYLRNVLKILFSSMARKGTSLCSILSEHTTCIRCVTHWQHFPQS